MGVWALAPNFNANAQAPAPGIQPARYRPLAQGEPAPYAGILIDVATYRLETEKFKLQDKTIAGGIEEIAGLKAKAITDAAEKKKLQEIIDGKTQKFESAQQTSAVIQQSLDVTQKAYESTKPKFFQKPLFLILVGFGVGAYTGIRFL